VVHGLFGAEIRETRIHRPKCQTYRAKQAGNPLSVLTPSGYIIAPTRKLIISDWRTRPVNLLPLWAISKANPQYPRQAATTFLSAGCCLIMTLLRARLRELVLPDC
jgi:hypothetical protein